MPETAQMSADMPWLAHYPAEVAWDAELPVEPLQAILDDTAARLPDHMAMDFLDRQWSYAELKTLSDRFAAGLQARGLGAGDHIGLCLPNCPYYPIAYFGVLKAGGRVVNLNPLYARRELETLIEDSACDTIITLDLTDLMGKLEPLLDATRLKRLVVCPLRGALPRTKAVMHTIFRRRQTQRPPADPQHLDFDALIDNDGAYSAAEIDPATEVAVLQYTGGTTGTPKAAALTHYNLRANVEQCVLWFHGAEDGAERMLAVIPFFHVFAMTAAMNMALRQGAGLVMLPRFEVEKVLQAINRKKVTIFPAVPTIYTAINNYRNQDRYDLSSLRFCLSGGAPLPREVKRDFEALSGCSLVEGYGLSETAPVATVNPFEKGDKTGSIGLPLPQTRIEVVDIEDGVTPLPLGERGEICISGPQVMPGYYGREDATREAFRGGRFHTGDVGYMDSEGYSFIVDRLKDMILAGGYNVYPRNIEEAIYEHPDVEECVVGGVPDPYRGETVKAWIKLRAGAELDADGLRGFLADKISRIEMPRQVEFRDEPLPKTLVGKLSRKTLLDEEKGAEPAASSRQSGEVGEPAGAGEAGEEDPSRPAG